MRNWPFVSVIIPVYNGEDTIGTCIASILDQDYPKDKFEVIVVDNDSKDDTRNVVQKYDVQYYMEDTLQGPSPARNTGAQHAKGEWLLFFDADQFAVKDYMKTLLSQHEDDSYGAFAGRNIGMNTTDSYLGEYWHREWEAKLSEGNIRSFIRFSGGNVVIKREIFKKLNGFDAALKTCEDTDLAWRIQNDLKLKVKYIPEALAHHRERVSLGALLKREFYFGFGGYLLGMKHKEAHRPLVSSIWKAIKRTVLGLLASILKIFKIMTGKARTQDLQLTLLDIAMNWSNCFGRICCKLKGR